MDPKNSNKSPIHENADANITCDFGDDDISRFRSFLSNTCDTYIHTSLHIVPQARRHDDGTTHSHVDFLNLIIDDLDRIASHIPFDFSRLFAF